MPVAPRQATEQEAIEQVVSGEQPVAWPPRGDTPLNEFHSEGYITRALDHQRQAARRPFKRYTVGLRLLLVRVVHKWHS